jgi:ammonia channel protein AmtB
MGFVDLGGAGVVHMIGGSCALVGSLMTGTRSGYFDNRYLKKHEKKVEKQKKLDKQRMQNRRTSIKKVEKKTKEPFEGSKK